MRQFIIYKLLDQAEAALQAGAVRHAVGLFHQVLRHDPIDACACENLFRYYVSVKKYPAAVTYAERLVKSVGPIPELLFELADLYHHAGDHQRAMDAYRRFLDGSPGTRSRPRGRMRKMAESRIAGLEALGLMKIGYDGSAPRRARPLGKPPEPPDRAAPGPSAAAPSPAQTRTQAPSVPAAAPAPAPAGGMEEPIRVALTFDEDKWTRVTDSRGSGSYAGFKLRLDFEQLNLLSQFEDLVCLPSLHGVESFWYQIETVRKVLRDFGGRVLLADEVGLGKTIEACMAIKEYILRGLARSVLILTPPGIVAQWREELAAKFSLFFMTSEDVDPAADPGFWDGERIIASINLAKSRAHFERVVSRDYDLVVVDEAHLLKNRATLNWKLVNALRKKYLFLMSATPVQNDLIELFNLITLLKPGALKTEAAFRRDYVRKGRPQEPLRPDSLRELLRGVMIRNTRSLVDVKLPRRFASTVVVPPSTAEREAYEAVSEMVRAAGEEEGDARRHRMLRITLLREAGSSPFALRDTLGRRALPGAERILDVLEKVTETGKGRKLLRLLEERRGEKAIVFTQFRRSLDYLAGLLDGAGIQAAVYHGGLAAWEKEAAIRGFKAGADVLLATESGGEGHNLQFATTLVNFDLPWNPMRIEQRIGRLHRIGQTRDVHVFNLCQRDTVEHYLIDVLDRKINLFELVIGEIDMILGNLDEEVEFSDTVFDLWAASRTAEEARAGFEKLGERLLAAKGEYQKSRVLDDALFQEEFEV